MEPFLRNLTGTEPLLQAIANQPHCLDTRLVLSDWLEEHEHPERAQFLRLHVARERSDACELEHRRLTELLEDLLQRHAITWLQGLPPRLLERYQRHRLHFAAGMLEAVTCSPDEVIHDLQPIRDLLPIRRVAFDGPPQRLDGRDVLDLPVMAGITHLDLNLPGLGLTGLRLPERPVHLNGVTTLRASYATLDHAFVESLARSTLLRTVERLDLSMNHLRDESIAALAQSPHLGPLRRLDVCNNPLQTASWQILGESPAFAGLTHLDLSFIGGSTDRLAALLRRREWQLEVLDLMQSALTSDDLRALVAAPGLSRLRALSLRRNPQVASGLALLGESDNLPSLTDLDLSETHLIEEQLLPFLRGNGLRGLRRLALSANRWGFRGLPQRGDFPLLHRLEWLDLHSNELGVMHLESWLEELSRSPLHFLGLGANRLHEAGCARMAEIQSWPNLRQLDLQLNHIDDHALAILLDAPWMEQLVELNLAFNPITDVGAMRLSRKGPTSLRRVDFRQCRLSLPAIQHLRERFPMVRV
ncbi:TIGR02996 domain-containing protein [Tuwongella immobilis]|uniref:Uncharacterized protein n=1 Tax=Tuwongella immobilis TaxID=692036 RepID=A0A6C2YJQ7_9BACT|nr:TIGR02996 domain-containing protein [Tuwongella immobilis]VIP01459.1 Leucine-rich repeat-containing protein typical subtype OS=Herpetosiphon aurantiacus (strain ATCC 23779 / DSM 785) GN=Haur_4051 PE=4 SV=1: LRR_6: LRR_6 [Tuwongella immobilis]VTR98469.1 Leucine-rich repeat-containing protein typical subtype OS=Herpetosiphon aurantiacus (strain ATCC 23779 / DSM 785) GN=Haur_4051 PE=4 SV=1: LRR_6: LRR_6 [Tuwongella immobilis]